MGPALLRLAHWLGLALAIITPLTLPLGCSSSGSSHARGTRNLVVLGASSLMDVLPRIDPKPRYSFGGSDELAAQITQGAPADVLLSASPMLTRALLRKQLIEDSRVFATNRVALVVPRTNPGHVASVADLARRRLKLVVGEPGVPIGHYARALLTKLRLSSALRHVVSDEPDARAILEKVALHEADAGFVYVTDARAAGDKIRLIPLPASAQPRITYVLATVKRSAHHHAAEQFTRKVVARHGRVELSQAGFGLP